jgi:hypothetical protein
MILVCKWLCFDYCVSIANYRKDYQVRAEVISLGDAYSYILSTAKNELGVMFAHSSAGETMIPISWEEMQCPVTGSTPFQIDSYIYFIFYSPKFKCRY